MPPPGIMMGQHLPEEGWDLGTGDERAEEKVPGTRWEGPSGAIRDFGLSSKHLGCPCSILSVAAGHAMHVFKGLVWLWYLGWTTQGEVAERRQISAQLKISHGNSCPEMEWNGSELPIVGGVQV